jgi:hypothetical protein
MADKITLISGTANPHLSELISNYLDKDVLLVN